MKTKIINGMKGGGNQNTIKKQGVKQNKYLHIRSVYVIVDTVVKQFDFEEWG